jgi:hypothetical protein
MDYETWFRVTREGVCDEFTQYTTCSIVVWEEASQLWENMV